VSGSFADSPYKTVCFANIPTAARIQHRHADFEPRTETFLALRRLHDANHRRDSERPMAISARRANSLSGFIGHSGPMGARMNRPRAKENHLTPTKRRRIPARTRARPTTIVPGIVGDASEEACDGAKKVVDNRPLTGGAPRIA
jgi:hypothetical protein